MMGDKCQHLVNNYCSKCKAPQSDFDAINVFFECGSIFAMDMNPHFQRSTKCFEAELASLKKLVREMAGLLSYAGKTLTLVGAMHHRPPDEYVDQMKEILDRPEVVVILEKG